MRKIYLDKYFWNDSNSGYYDFAEYQDNLPSDCEVIGISFNSNFYDEYLKFVNQLLPKTQKLIVVAHEPTDTGSKYSSFQNFVESLSNSKIEIYGSATINFPSDNYQTIVPWFDGPNNHYATDQWAKHLITQLDFGTVKLKKFDALLGCSRWQRDIIRDFYLNSKFKSDIIYSYYGRDIKTGIWDLDLGSSKETIDLVNFQGTPVRISCILPVEIYNQSYYSIISETTCMNTHSHYTEKTAKALVARRPFVMFSGQHFLRNLRSLGFQTFNIVIDESYDDIADHKERFSAAWAQVEKLCQLDAPEVLFTLKSVLDHNQKHFIQTDWHAPIRQYLCPLPE
jgi:hypothetical protein